MKPYKLKLHISQVAGLGEIPESNDRGLSAFTSKKEEKSRKVRY
jgi:hypothetical protein